jgi:hypothetical protein
MKTPLDLGPVGFLFLFVLQCLTIAKETTMSSLREAIALIRAQLDEGVAPFRTVRLLDNAFSTRADRTVSHDPKESMNRAWHYRQAAESRRDRSGIAYWQKKYESHLSQYRAGVLSRNFELGENDEDETGFVPPHRQR